MSPTADPALRPAALSIRGLTKRFGGVLALDSCTFDVAKGSLTGLIGPNGAGKSTLFHAVAGFLRPDAGQVLLDGRDVTGRRPHQLVHLGLTRTFQIPHEFQKLTVLESLMLVPAGQFGETLGNAWLRWGTVRAQEAKVRARAQDVLNFLQLDRVRDEYAGNLSGGQKKLLELGRAIMAEPSVVLLDEPGAGVNPTLKRKLLSHIHRLNEEAGLTFCIIEHDMEMIASLCDPVVVMASGRLLAQGSMDEVRADLSVIEAYLSRGAPTAAGHAGA